MVIHCLQHVAFETPGSILVWASEKGHTIHYTYFFENDYHLPDVNDFDMLLIMGGYMNVGEEDRFPWLNEEKALIRKSINAGKKVLGICLGSQLIAAATGARVYAGAQKEIGFFPIQFTEAALRHPLFDHFENPYTVFHWHGDTFDLPAGATLLASTNICPHQAYLIGNNVLALQFHFEMTPSVIEDMLLHDGHELAETGAFIQDANVIKTGYPQLQQNQRDMFTLLNRFVRL
jgi:GMP synthase-like glutamine amidotransferase